VPTPTTRLNGLNRTLFHPGQRVACALSGGADSTALLLALLDANAEKDSLGLVLSAIHIHHGLRGPEADADETFVRNLCSQHNIPLAVEHVDTPARQQSEREGLEEAARELRYAAFRNLLSQNKADAVATAHTLDDQAETVLMKLLRGAWTEGLGGISPSLVLPEGDLRLPGSPGVSVISPNRPPAATQQPSAILRPLLQTSRAEIERFLGERRQPWREDTSNADTTLTRNRVRHQLMPLLRSFNPAVDETLARTAEIAREDHAFWQGEVARVLPGLVLPGKPVRGGGRAVSTSLGEQSSAIEIERLRAHPPALRRRLLRAAAADLGCRLNAAESAKLLALAGLAHFPGLNGRNGARLELGNGLRAERSLRELRLSREAGLRIPKKV
jgi:tRNA(Ile)-lysidine synthase